MLDTRGRVFARMWGVAVLAHLAGNPFYGDISPRPSLIGFVLAAAGLLATALVLSPRRWIMLALGIVVPLSVILEAPVLGNHWLLAGFVSVAYLLTLGDRDRFEPAARGILLVFYAFAAFAKLNTGFLDPATSCGLFYANQALGEWGIGPFSPRGLVGLAVAWASALVELSVPILLVIRRTRTIGVLVGIAFHGLISFDTAQHFYDFTAVLLPLFVLFLGDGYFKRFESIGHRLRPRLRRVLAAMVTVIGLGVTLANVTPSTELSLRILTDGSFIWWIPYLAAVVWSAAGSLQPVAVRWRMGPVAAVLVAIVFVNGLTPYLELKTAYGWNMYSNLVTVDGESNHLLVRSTWQLRDGQKDLVTVVSSDDPGLQAYADQGYLLPWPSFLLYTSARPDIAINYARAGSVVEVPRVADDPVLSAPVPWWWRWMPLRAVHAETPDRCQTGFLPAL